jgi:hypothetical protein
MPESCADLKLIGYKMNGFFQIKGKEKIENVYCDFTTNAIGKHQLINFIVQYTSSYSLKLDRVAEMDWIRRNQISVCLFLRPEKF